MPSSKIAVIGAGMTGITAARSLTNAGHAVQVFEKSRGSGGRLASKRSEMGRVNLGAQGFSTNDPVFLRELNDWQQAGWVEHNHTDQNQWTGTPYMSALTRNLLGEINTQFACEIRELSYDHNGWLLHDQHAQTHGPFQKLIVAIPAPQASVLLRNCAAGLAEQAATVEMQPIWMVALGFNQPITPTHSLAHLNNSIIADIIQTPLSAEHPMQTWMLRASVAWSTEHLEDDHQQVIDSLTKAFSALFNQPLTFADSSFAHRWRYALGALNTPAKTLTDLSRGLVIAGDWCGHGDTQSAWFSGKQAAQQLINN
ncbi:MAG TPA: NAD(P)-binding protein [Gammaproteobacteria bacterium]|nr:NAD(P)-binding protein [Gammaproteobacteria bacterium]